MRFTPPIMNHFENPKTWKLLKTIISFKSNDSADAGSGAASATSAAKELMLSVLLGHMAALSGSHRTLTQARVQATFSVTAWIDTTGPGWWAVCIQFYAKALLKPLVAEHHCKTCGGWRNGWRGGPLECRGHASRPADPRAAHTHCARSDRTRCYFVAVPCASYLSVCVCVCVSVQSALRHRTREALAVSFVRSYLTHLDTVMRFLKRMQTEGVRTHTYTTHTQTHPHTDTHTDTHTHTHTHTLFDLCSYSYCMYDRCVCLYNW